MSLEASSSSSGSGRAPQPRSRRRPRRGPWTQTSSPRAGRLAREPRTQPAEADHAGAAAPQAAYPAGDRRRVPDVPRRTAASRAGIRALDREQQGDRVVGSLVDAVVRDVRDDDAGGCGGAEVDLVDADPEPADHPASGERRDHAGGQRLVERENRRRFPPVLDQLLLRRGTAARQAGSDVAEHCALGIAHLDHARVGLEDDEVGHPAASESSATRRSTPSARQRRGRSRRSRAGSPRRASARRPPPTGPTRPPGDRPPRAAASTESDGRRRPARRRRERPATRRDRRARRRRSRAPRPARSVRRLCTAAVLSIWTPTRGLGVRARRSTRERAPVPAARLGPSPPRRGGQRDGLHGRGGLVRRVHARHDHACRAGVECAGDLRRPGLSRPRTSTGVPADEARADQQLDGRRGPAPSARPRRTRNRKPKPATSSAVTRLGACRKVPTSRSPRCEHGREGRRSVLARGSSLIGNTVKPARGPARARAPRSRAGRSRR